MNATTDILIKDLAKTIANAPAKKVTPYDTTAEVRRVEGNIAWVHIPGGVDETPVQLTTNAKKGDIVQVRVSGGQAWLYGNSTAPPTDDTKAIQAEKKAVTADEHASDAMISATLAKDAADSAIEDAARASSAAHSAEEAAERADGNAADALDAAGRAETAAGDASRDAASAYNSASQAINQLGIVEDIVGVLELISNKGVYALTDDPGIVSGKWYFELEGTVVIPEGTENPHSQGWYELSNSIYSLTADETVTAGKNYYTVTASVVNTPQVEDLGRYYELLDIDKTIQNYVSSHLSLVGNSLFLQTSEGESSTRLELNTQNGMTLYDQIGNPVAQYGTDAVIGNQNEFHITVTPNYYAEVYNPIGNPSEREWYELNGEEYTLTEDTSVINGKTYYKREPRLSFWRGPQNDRKNEVAYISGDKLYITQSVVLQQMDVGSPISNGGLGQWSWKVHAVNGMNNLYLKWLG